MSRSKLAKEYILYAQGGKNRLHKKQHVDNHKCFAGVKKHDACVAGAHTLM